MTDVVESWRYDGEGLIWCRGVHVGRFGTCHGAEVAEARARLASAAPDMLAVLKELEWCVLKPGTGDYQFDPKWQCFFCLATEAPHSRHGKDCPLAAAIAKAEGR